MTEPTFNLISDNAVRVLMNLIVFRIRIYLSCMAFKAVASYIKHVLYSYMPG